MFRSVAASRLASWHGVERLRGNRARTRNEEQVMTEAVVALTATLLVALLVIDRLTR
jgi:hypothetical protein